MSWWQEQRRAWASDWGLARSGLCGMLGFFTRVSVYAALLGAFLGLLFMFWPSTNLFDTPLASLTLGQILYTVCFWLTGAAIGSTLVSSLFNPSNDPEIKKSWAAYSVPLIILLIVIAIVYLTRK